MPGTGQGGRISKKDIEAYLKTRGAAPAAAAASGVALGKSDRPRFRPAPEARFGEHTVEPLSTMRRKIAEHMSLTMGAGASTSSTVHQIDCTAVAKLRDEQKQKFYEHNAVKLTFMPFFLRAAAAALKEFPAVNASLDADQVVYHREVNIAVGGRDRWRFDRAGDPRR